MVYIAGFQCSFRLTLNTIFQLLIAEDSQDPSTHEQSFLQRVARQGKSF